MRSVVILVVALAADLVTRRRLPIATVLAGAAYAIAGGLTDVLKGAFARPRPSLVDPAVHPLVAVPHSAAMPSGHASTAFAAAVAVGLVHPRLRWPLLALAALIALSRVWLGVHYPTDVIAGAALGAAIAIALWRVSIRVFTHAGPVRDRR